MSAINPKFIKDEDVIFIEQWKLRYSGLFCKNYKHGLLLNGMYNLFKCN